MVRLSADGHFSNNGRVNSCKVSPEVWLSILGQTFESSLKDQSDVFKKNDGDDDEMKIFRIENSTNLSRTILLGTVMMTHVQLALLTYWLGWAGVDIEPDDSRKIPPHSVSHKRQLHNMKGNKILSLLLDYFRIHS